MKERICADSGVGENQWNNQICTGLPPNENGHREGFVAALDFSKAFNSVSWSLIFRPLLWFNFGENFIDMVAL